MTVEIFQEPLRRRYYAPYFSCAYAFFLITVGVLVLLPFLLSYNSYGFWLKEKIYYEPVQNRYEYKLLCEGSGYDNVLSEDFSFFYSTIKSVNSLRDNTFRPSTLKSTEVDVNHDNIAEGLKLHLSLPLGTNEIVKSTSCLLFFETTINKRVKLQMGTMAFVSAQSSVGGNNVFIHGDYEFHQSKPLPVTGGFKILYGDQVNGEVLLDESLIFSAKETAFLPILQKYIARNNTMEFVTRHEPYWSTTVIDSNSNNKFNLNIDVNFPQYSPILYRPPTLEVLQAAWISYLSAFLVVGFLMERLCSFIYFHQIVESRMLVESVASKSGSAHFKGF